VLAATVRTHGASFSTLRGNGPEFPAAQLTNIPFLMAENVLMAMLSRWNGTDLPPSDMDKMSTPSVIAEFIPAIMFEA
jgi:hypothetical protein